MHICRAARGERDGDILELVEADLAVAIWVREREVATRGDDSRAALHMRGGRPDVEAEIERTRLRFHRQRKLVELRPQVFRLELCIRKINAEREVRRRRSGDVYGQFVVNGQRHFRSDVAELIELHIHCQLRVEADVEIQCEGARRIVVVAFKPADELGGLILDGDEQPLEFGLFVERLHVVEIRRCRRLEVEQSGDVVGGHEVEHGLIDDGQLLVQRGVPGDVGDEVVQLAERIENLALKAQVGDVILQRDVRRRADCEDIGDIHEHRRETSCDDVQREF